MRSEGEHGIPQCGNACRITLSLKLLLISALINSDCRKSLYAGDILSEKKEPLCAKLYPLSFLIFEVHSIQHQLGVLITLRVIHHVAKIFPPI